LIINNIVLMKKLMNAILCFLLLSTFIKVEAQTNTKTFNKNEAIIWLNAKMEGASRFSTVRRGEWTTHKPKFSNCSYYSKLSAGKMNVYNALNGIKDEPLFYNEYTVSLNTLDPSSAIIEKEDDKFFIKVNTTNSLNTVTRKIFYPNQSSPAEVTNFSNISFGPFECGNNLESRALNVIKQLITSCGGKKEAF
jgi:hypothetical protein